MLFIETPVFTRLVAATLNDADYAAFQQSLADRPDAGRLIEGGAARTDLTPAQIRQLAEAARALK